MALLLAAAGCGLAVAGSSAGSGRSGEEAGATGGGSSGGRSSGSGSSTSGSSTNGSSSSGGTIDLGPGALEAGADGPLPSSGADAAAGSGPEGGSSQGAMACPPGGDAGECDLSSDVCCTCPNCFAPYPTECMPSITGCVGVVFSGVYATLRCGDSTNCAAGSVCCAEFNATPALTGSSCLAGCTASGSVELCTGSGQCPSGKSCSALASVPGFSGCQ